MSVRRCFVDGDYGQIHCRVAGSPSTARDTVVCLHMSPKSGRSYAALLPELAKQHLVLAPDYPGYGESDLPPAEPAVRIEDYAKAVWQCIEALGVGPCHLVGHHTGSKVAVEVTHQQPERVRSLVAISTPVFTPQELAEIKATYAPIELNEAGDRFRIIWERILYHRGPGMSLEMAAESMAETLRSGDAYEWGHRAAFEYAPRFAERLAQLSLPILVINPADDCAEASRRVDRFLRNGKRVDFPDWGHGFLQAYPAAVAEVLEAFFASIEASPPDQHLLTRTTQQLGIDR